MLQGERQKNTNLNEELTKTKEEVATMRKKLDHFSKSTRILERNLQGCFLLVA